MDKQLKLQILAEVRAAITTTLESAEEKWLSAEELCKQFQCFSPGWLEDHGKTLPRTKVAHSNRWCYPMHKINRLLNEGKI